MNLNRNHKSLFTFYLGKNVDNDSEFENELTFGDYIFCYNNTTPIQYSFSENKGIILFGLAVNLNTCRQNKLAEEILENCDDIFSVIEYEKNLGGKYVILFWDKNRYYCLPDATASIPVFYSKDSYNSTICTSHSQLIISKFNFSPNNVLLKIRNSGDISQAMPYNVTEYKEILQLLPNHFLDLNCYKSIRYINQKKQTQPILASKAAEITLPLIKVLTKFYISKFSCYCPITGGRDSRVVLAAMQNVCNKKINCYTIKHKNHRNSSPDLVIPLQICNVTNINHQIVHDKEVDSELIDYFNQLLGKNKYSQRTAMIAHTINHSFNESAIINGDIIGQVGKCSLHRDIPSCLATAGYFRCKLHNYSKESKKLLQEWLEEIKNSGECVNTFDLFSIENRMGRWAAQENLVYNTLGQLYLNVFNSRNIIYTWALVDRKERKNSSIHIELIKLLNSSLLDIEFEQDTEVLTKFSKSNGITYYLFSWLKFWYERIRFFLKR